tara:strand:+ start:340 stop:468 length:129 start_codon:yes stop_codon:yes gene_type:complete
MTPKTSYLVEIIYKKLKKYRPKEIFLEKENLEEFISSLFKED